MMNLDKCSFFGGADERLALISRLTSEALGELYEPESLDYEALDEEAKLLYQADEAMYEELIRATPFERPELSQKLFKTSYGALLEELREAEAEEAAEALAKTA